MNVQIKEVWITKSEHHIQKAIRRIKIPISCEIVEDFMGIPWCPQRQRITTNIIPWLCIQRQFKTPCYNLSRITIVMSSYGKFHRNAVNQSYTMLTLKRLCKIFHWVLTSPLKR